MREFLLFFLRRFLPQGGQMPLKEIIALNISLLVIAEGYGVPLTTIECKNALLQGCAYCSA